MKPILSLIATLFLPIFLFAQNYDWYNDPNAASYEISSGEQLKGLAALVNSTTPNNFSGKTIKLAKDIALTGTWTPIGDYTSNARQFQGTFDGQGHTISGLLVNGGDYAGLFGYVGTGGQIKNLNVVAADIKTTTGGTIFRRYAGGLAGYYASSKSIENCGAKANSIIGSGSGNGYGGGLVGYSSAILTITNSYASGNASGGDFASYVGGLVGYSSAILTITNSYASGNATGNAGSSADGYGYGAGYVGGLVGCASSSNMSTITNSYASGNISGTGAGFKHIGGIFGRYASGTNTSVYYKTEGASNPAGLGSPTGITALADANMKKKAFFQGWDFDGIWGIKDGYTYPYLRFVAPPEFYIPLNDDIEAEYIHDQTYTGSEIKPEPKIKLKEGGTLLVKGTDYVLSYQNNKNTGTGTVKIIGIDGAYLGLEETISFSITPKTLTITDAAVQDKVYDGKTQATITGTLNGAIAGDNVSFNSAGSFASKDAGTGIAVTANITLTGTAAANYKLTQPEGLSANITKKPLTITLNPKTVTIAQSDPMTKVTDKIVYNGLVSGETSSVITGTTAVFENGLPLNSAPAVGAHTITLSGTRTTANYSYTYDNTGLQLIVTADPVNLSTCTVTDIPAQEYSKEQKMPDVSVSCGGSIIASTNYTLAYGANINAGNGTVTITGIGSYIGSVNKTFTINKKALSVTEAVAEGKIYDGTTTAAITGATLSGGIIDGDVVALSNSSTGTFASANAGENIAVSTNMSLTGTSAANYSLTQPGGLKASIEAKSLAADAIQTIASQTFTGLGITPAIVVKDGSKTLAKDTDYTLTFSSNTNAGTATARVIGNGNYNGNITANFTIIAKSITISMIDPIPSQIHTGNAIEPAIAIKNGTVPLTAGTDYEVEYEDNVEIGTAVATVSGKGNYSGEAHPSFEITAIPSSSSETATPSSSSTITTPSSSSSSVSSSSSSTITTPSSSSNNSICAYQASWCNGNPASANAVSTTPATGADKCFFVSDVSAMHGQGIKINGVMPNSNNGSEFVCGLFNIVSCASILPAKQDGGYYIYTGAWTNNSSSYTNGTPNCGTTPIRLPQIAGAPIRIHTTSNAIVLENLPTNARVEVYSLQGKQVYSAHPENPQILRIGVQTKGIYIVKTGTQIKRVAVR
jgi:hypothetical protein